MKEPIGSPLGATRSVQSPSVMSQNLHSLALSAAWGDISPSRLTNPVNDGLEVSRIYGLK